MIAPFDGLDQLKGAGWGGVVLMAGYYYPWTQASSADNERICIVFDVVPRERELRKRDSDESEPARGGFGGDVRLDRAARHEALETLARNAKNNPRALLHIAQEMIATRPRRAAALAIEILGMEPPVPIATAAEALLKDMAPRWHFVIVRDSARNAAYDQALRGAVTPQSRVLDIGSGTGLLAMMAARAGAAEVFTCEQNAAVAEGARRVLEANGLGDRVRLIGKHSSKLDLDRDLGGPLDVLVSEIVSNNLIGEGCLAVMEEAARWLKPEGRMIPQAGTVRVALAWSDVAESEDMGTVEGFDLSAFNMLGEAARQHQVGDPRIDLRSSSTDLMQFDFRSGGPFRAHEARATVIADGRPANGVIQWIRLNMDDHIVYENQPAPGAKSCWAALFYRLPEIVKRPAGEAVRIAGTHDRVSLFIWVEAAG